MTEQDGATLLDAIETFLGRFVAYPSDATRLAHVLWIAHTWFMDEWDSTPRIAFLSPEPGSGKSRALEVTELLVPRPVHAVNTTPAYLFRKVSDKAGRPTILYDEIDTVFGPKAKDNEDIRGILNAGHRKGAMAGRAVVRGQRIVTEELPAYCAVALAGLNDLPDTLMARSVIVRMRRRSPTETVEPWRMRTNGPEAEILGNQIGIWAAEHQHRLEWPDIPDGIEDRNADIWEPLLAVADLAGGEWPDRARQHAATLVADTSARTGSLGVTLLRDLRRIFGNHDRLSTETILEQLHDITESPWFDLRGKQLDSRGLARRLAKYDIKPKPIRIDGNVSRGYDAADLADPWSRYLSPETSASVTDGEAGDVTPVTGSERDVTDVTLVTDLWQDAPEDVTDPEALSTTSNNYTITQLQPHRNGQTNTKPLSPRTSVTSVTSVTDHANGHHDDPPIDLFGNDPDRCPHGYAPEQRGLHDCGSYPS